MILHALEILPSSAARLSKIEQAGLVFYDVLVETFHGENSFGHWARFSGVLD